MLFAYSPPGGWWCALQGVFHARGTGRARQYFCKYHATEVGFRAKVRHLSCHCLPPQHTTPAVAARLAKNSDIARQCMALLLYMLLAQQGCTHRLAGSQVSCSATCVAVQNRPIFLSGVCLHNVGNRRAHGRPHHLHECMCAGAFGHGCHAMDASIPCMHTTFVAGQAQDMQTHHQPHQAHAP